MSTVKTAASKNGKSGENVAGDVMVPAMELKTYVIGIVGDSPLIVHAWSQKAILEIEGKQQGKAKGKKEPRNPEQEYEAAFHRLPGGAPGFPTIAFKAAAVSAARQVDGLKMTFLRGAFHVVGELVEIQGMPEMRTDMVRIGMGTADVRYRPEFKEWSTQLKVRLNSRSLTLEQLLHLFNQAGFSVGVGEWRPERNGSYGMFHVETFAEVRE